MNETEELAGRQTRKSRTVSELSDAVVDLVSNQGIMAPSKTQIVDQVVSANVIQGVSQSIRSLLEIEVSNMLKNYFADVCKEAQKEVGLPYHYTSKRYYRSRRKTPESREEAQQWVVVFGNGRTGKAAGVRFVTPDDEPDAMLLICLEKRIDVVNEAIKTHQQRLQNVLCHEAVGAIDRDRLLGRLPLLEQVPSLAIPSS